MRTPATMWVDRVKVAVAFGLVSTMVSPAATAAVPKPSTATAVTAWCVVHTPN